MMKIRRKNERVERGRISSQPGGKEHRTRSAVRINQRFLHSFASNFYHLYIFSHFHGEIWSPERRRGGTLGGRSEVMAIADFIFFCFIFSFFFFHKINPDNGSFAGRWAPEARLWSYYVWASSHQKMRRNFFAFFFFEKIKVNIFLCFYLFFFIFWILSGL